ncbi:hypothetical protein [Streptomyces massasporeus]|uniref:hypothetical protein n=1 Tax=Streptomyces massasporeus TaxID=67324 RepID=UPI003F4B6A6D
MRSRTSPISRPVTIRRAVAPATAVGYRRLLDWSGKRGTVRGAGVEGAGTFGAGLSRFLLAQRVQVDEVNRPDRSGAVCSGSRTLCAVTLLITTGDHSSG